MRYIYQHTQTQGTTGFARCIPELELTLAEALELLHKRPLDSFLHQYALELLLGAPSAKWSEMAAECVLNPSPVLAALLIEAHEIAGLKSPEALQKLAEPIERHSPLRINHHPQDDFYRNIHQHLELPTHPGPFTPAQISQTREKMKASSDILARLHGVASLPSSQPPPMPPEEIYRKALEALAKGRIEVGEEMRHEASLSPIALLRSWTLKAGTAGVNEHTLAGNATAYGKGLKLAHARIGCIMEIVERACAHAFVTPQCHASYLELRQQGEAAIDPEKLGARDSQHLSLHWIRGETARGEKYWVPAQAAYLFCNLPEVNLFSHIGSTGLASGITEAGAKLSALVEVLERDAHATMPFRKDQVFEIYSQDPIIQGLLADYRWRGIKIQFQDITTEFGVPTYRCFVQAQDGKIAQATGANLNGAKAAISALTETPWPYAWAHPVRAPSGPGIPDAPGRLLEGLPNFELASDAQSLHLLENTLMSCGFTPVYVNLSRLGLPVFRAFVPGLEIDPELEHGPSLRLLAHQ